MTKIAFLGLGQMGRRMAANLVAASHDVIVWNRSSGPAEAFAARAGSPAEAAASADIILTMLTDDQASHQVWAEVLLAAKPGALAVEMSTLSPARIAALSGEAEAKGLTFIDAPVAGTPPQAEAGQLIFLAGGTDKALARFAPLVEAMGSRIVHAGPTGKGAVLKLMVNTLLATQTALAAELTTFGKIHGVVPDDTARLLADLPVTSPATAISLRQIAEGQHAPLFPIDLMIKDLRYALDGWAAPLTETTLQAFERAQSAGHGALHISAVALAD